jgi:hypothetical protein
LAYTVVTGVISISERNKTTATMVMNLFPNVLPYMIITSFNIA